MMKITFPKPIEGQTHWAVRGSNPESEPILIPIMDTDETAQDIIRTDSKMEVFIPSKTGNIGNQYVAIADLQRMAKFWLMRAEIAMALDRSRVAIDDWLNVDFADFCDEERVIEAQQRINEFGTVAYIADVQQQSRDLLKRIAEVENG